MIVTLLGMNIQLVYLCIQCEQEITSVKKFNKNFSFLSMIRIDESYAISEKHFT
jgi:hypothetical protein